MSDTPIPVTNEEYSRASEAYDGICLECRSFTTSGVEPDAEKYKCDRCGNFSVFGCEEALLRELITITE